MATETLFKTVNSNGEYSCGEIGISTEEWYGLLQDKDASPYVDALVSFLRQPGHKGTCSIVSIKYGKPSSYYNSKIVHFAKWVKKKLNRFQVVGTDGNETFWCIVMQKGWETKQGFQWQLRDELVEALQSFLMKGLITILRSRESFNGYEEEYKWELLDNTEGKETLDIIKSLRGKNIIDNARVDGVIKTISESNAEELAVCGNHLLDESQPLEDRLAAYKREMRSLCPSDWNNCGNDERTAAAILTCKYPEIYTFYKDEVYQIICQYFGFENRKVGKKYIHFIEIINKFASKFGEEIQQVMLPEIGKFRNKPLNLAVQTLFWCMKGYLKERMKGETRSYWLTGYSFGSNRSQLERFINEGIWESKHDDDNESDQKTLAIVKNISVHDVIILKSTSTKGPRHDQPFMRIKAVGVVTSNIETSKTEGSTYCRCDVEYVSLEEKDFDGQVYGSYRKTIHKADSKIKDIIDYVNSILYKNDKPQMKYKEYIELLQENYNLVLTGAPGTGKTYMAHAIAEEMGAVAKFVQFHPSYDYTDFVEGLRPIERGEDQMGFTREDGIFKAFCKEAIKNMEDSEKSVENLTKELSWQEKLDDFVEDASENGTKFNTVNGSEFTIYEMHSHSVLVHNETNEKTTRIAVNADEILDLLKKEIPLNNVRDIRNHYGRKYGTQADSYAYVIVREIRKMKTKVTVAEANKVEKKPYVFIIDEINRGEASKIFGELFYAIDPGYRGMEDKRVQTQYQNLVKESDPFAKGFYVPDNVYILATMNDIDRSVESMDFAMRRRFLWKEVKPEATQEMLDSLGETLAVEAKETMSIDETKCEI